MKCEEKVAKRITRALGLGVLMRYRAGVVFLLSGLLIIIVHSRGGQTRTTSTIKTTNREAEMKVNVFCWFEVPKGGAYLAKLDSAKSETALQERAKPNFAIRGN